MWNNGNGKCKFMREKKKKMVGEKMPGTRKIDTEKNLIWKAGIWVATF